VIEASHERHAAVLCCRREKNLEKALKEAKVKARRWGTFASGT
jgi:hypothetical protein